MPRNDKPKSQSYEINHLVISPLENFTSDQDEIILTPNLSIIRLQSLSSPLEKSLFEAYDDHRSMQFDSSEFVGDFSHILRWHLQKEIPVPLRNHYDILFYPIYQFDKVIQALRIVKNEHIQVRVSTNASFLDGVPELAILTNPLVDKFPEFAKFQHPLISYGEHERRAAHVFPGDPVLDICRLDSSEEIGYLKATMNILDKDTSGLQIAITRLANYYLRYDVADRIIDTVIALEILYLYGVKEEVSYKLCLRVAAHLGRTDNTERERLFNLAKIAYNLRSGIAHGGLYTIKDIENDKEFRKSGYSSVRLMLTDLIAMLKKALRSIILEVGEQRFKADFHKAIERCILTGVPFSAAELPQPGQK